MWSDYFGHLLVVAHIAAIVWALYMLWRRG